jgi:hypothetical protein
MILSSCPLGGMCHSLEYKNLHDFAHFKGMAGVITMKIKKNLKKLKKVLAFLNEL